MTTQIDTESASVERVIVPRMRDLGNGFQVRRALPAAERQMVGPFIFFDQMGPAVFSAAQGMDVRPHPHIGLATVTYLLQGKIRHRDSLGKVQDILPGEVNWMTAGSGIVHSERTPPAVREQGGTLSGFQLWVALPKTHEETTPAFFHADADELPLLEDDHARGRVIAGTYRGAISPVKTFSHTLYVDVTFQEGSRWQLAAEHEERAAYIVEGQLEVEHQRYDAGRLLLFRPGVEIILKAPTRARALLLGGETMDGPRHIWWNFVSSAADRIEQARSDWREQRFGHVPTETEFIPLPD